ncbi:MAG: MBL fold metallo-hydrolase [Spirochaetaceae bacterium]|jgi:glyoxylase-like metal-dependent hydrolase (beta-lactamase superfamily II)|nr:MBL fold metallo-hydrolase [Spirochaetaceae bacterium]
MNSQVANPVQLVVGALATNCWIYAFPGDASVSGVWEPYRDNLCVLIDPGCDAPVIIARLERLKRYPRSILLTHGHFDHVAALAGVVSYYRETYGLDPEIAIHKDDADALGPDALRVHRISFTAAVGNAVYVDELWEPLPPPTRLLAEGDTAGPFTVLHLPGHSKGSAGFYDESRKTLFSGDTLFNGGIGRTDLPGGDFKTIAASLKRLLAMDETIAVYPGHGSVTSIKEEQSSF